MSRKVALTLEFTFDSTLSPAEERKVRKALLEDLKLQLEAGSMQDLHVSGTDHMLGSGTLDRPLKVTKLTAK